MRAVILLALVGAAMAVPKNTQRIVGGSVTDIETYPYMSNMQYGWFGIWWFQSCGGSLITATTVLSASHCYEGDSPSVWKVRLGSSLASSGGFLHDVSSIRTHEGYTSSAINNDVALVFLASPASFSDSIAAARIPSSTYNLGDGETVTSIGWGTTSSGGSSSEQLRHVDTNVINHQECARRYAYLKTQPGYQNWPDITDGMLCAGILDVGGKDACQGDSGGPLAHHGDIVVGVTSWGLGCADAYYPGVNARVSQYTDWILAYAT